MNDHPDTVRIAIKTGAETTELTTYPWPELGEDEGMLRIETCGVGGAEPEVYRAMTGYGRALLGLKPGEFAVPSRK